MSSVQILSAMAPFYLPRPRDLEITYTPQFTDIVHELRGHIGKVRNSFGSAAVGLVR